MSLRPRYCPRGGSRAASTGEQRIRRTSRTGASSCPPSKWSAARRLVSGLGLTFGAIDLVLDEQGALQFLEINPNGEWMWIEDLVGYPVSLTTIASFLTSLSQHELYWPVLRHDEGWKSSRRELNSELPRGRVTTFAVS